MTRVSAVIAAFNQQDYIVEAVSSLLDQVDEVVVVDDQSEDQTVTALRSIDAPGLVVIENTDRLGVSRSFNRAVEASTGDILLIQGGDDRSLPHRARNQVALLADPDVSVACSLPIVIDGRGERLPSHAAGEFSVTPEDVDVVTQLFTRGNHVCAPSAAVRRSDYLGRGGFRGGIDLLQDYLLWMQLAESGRIVVDETPVVEYRKHASNTSREYVGLDAPRQRRLTAELDYCRWLFLSAASPATRRRLATGLGLLPSRLDGLDDAEQRALIALAHPDRLMVRRGLDVVFDAAGAADADERLARLGLEVRDLANLAAVADHENVAAIERALAVGMRSAAEGD